MRTRAEREQDAARSEAFERTPLRLRILERTRNPDFFVPGFTLDSRGMFVLLEYVAELEARLTVETKRRAEWEAAVELAVQRLGGRVEL